MFGGTGTNYYQLLKNQQKMGNREKPIDKLANAPAPSLNFEFGPWEFAFWTPKSVRAAAPFFILEGIVSVNEEEGGP